MSGRHPDIVEEAARLARLAEAKGVGLRVLGGIAVRMRCPDVFSRPALVRAYKDLDFAVPRRDARATRDLLTAEGYQPNQRFNTMQGSSRLLFYDDDHSRQVDVFVGSFEMCHKLDLEPRLTLPGPALPPSDLLLLKLQIVQLNQKDVTDTLALLLQYAPQPGDGADALSTTYISRLCASNWGWYTTLHDNLAAVRERTGELLTPADAETVRSRVDVLLAAIDGSEKSVAWRLRDKVGRRKIWYELPEEVAR
jgi:hypothetical protein